MSELDKRPQRALKEAVFVALTTDDSLDNLLPTAGGHTIVQKPTSYDDGELADAVLRVAVSTAQTTPRGTVDQHSHDVQIQIDWTPDWHRARGPDWEDDVHDAIHEAVGRLSGKAFKARGLVGSQSAVYSADLDRYLADRSYQYQTAVVEQTDN